MKLIFQIVAAIVLILGDIKIDAITNPFTKTSKLIDLGVFYTNNYILDSRNYKYFKFNRWIRWLGSWCCNDFITIFLAVAINFTIYL